MSLLRVFDTAIPYVFDMCSAPGYGCKPPVIATDVSTVELGMVSAGEIALASGMIVLTSEATWHLPLTDL
jgi:hypothetical protein